MVAEKSPGTDDLPHEFYKGFWLHIGEIIPNALKFSYVLPEDCGSPVLNHLQRAVLGSVVIRGYW